MVGCSDRTYASYRSEPLKLAKWKAYELTMQVWVESFRGDFENKSRISSTVPGRQFSTVTTFGDPEAPSSPSGVGIAA